MNHSEAVRKRSETGQTPLGGARFNGQSEVSVFSAEIYVEKSKVWLSYPNTVNSLVIIHESSEH